MMLAPEPGVALAFLLEDGFLLDFLFGGVVVGVQ